MNSTITPIMALNLMSCTEPVIPFENNNTTISTNANDTNLYENKNDFKTEYYGGFTEIQLSIIFILLIIIK